MPKLTTIERLATLEEQSKIHTEKLHEIGSDVKLLLASKWKAEGKRSVLTVLTASLVAFLTALISR